MSDINTIEQCWNTAKHTIKNTMLNEADYPTLIEPLTYTFENNIFILTTENDLTKSIICDLYLKNIKEIMDKLLGYSLSIVVRAKNTVSFQPQESVSDKTVKKQTIDRFSMPLNDELCFETFVVGKNNQLAQACSKAVSLVPGKKYNPLFIYGDSGLGKTHLMQAIGNEIKRNDSAAKIFYTTGEYFTSLYVEAVRLNTLDTFRRKIRNYDIFLLDDIQFLMNKEGTIQEFFNTFNTLLNTKKQIVLTSDRAPKDLQMDERVSSRLEQGMLTDVAKPDFETRLAILKDKAKRENIQIPDEVLQYVAKFITSNIRQLEGALTRLMAQSSLLKKEINVEFVKESLFKEYTNANKICYDPDKIIDAVSRFFNIAINDLKSSSRQQNISLARHTACYIMKELTELSYKQIATKINRKDHSTIIHSCKYIEEKLHDEPDFRQTINEITNMISI